MAIMQTAAYSSWLAASLSCFNDCMMELNFMKDANVHSLPSCPGFPPMAH
jgi:hypothetical protein